MGNAAYRQTTTNQYADQDVKNFMQIDLPKFVMHNRIGNGKFMKSYIMKVETTPLVVKVYMKLPDEDLAVPAVQLTFLWKTISPTKYPNLMPYQIWIKSNTRIKSPNSPIYLIRQYFHSNLYDRLSTRPFLLEIEKYWIIFQLLKCLEICHHYQIIHGDLKPENIMCTTSNWIVLTDFSPFKPVFIPDDDTTDFQYYFESSVTTRHRCYIAPERFLRKSSTGKVNSTGSSSNRNTGSLGKTTISSGSGRINGIETTPGAGLLPSMDIFSLGCVMAEILLDGTALLDLPAMLQYLQSSAESLGPMTPGVSNLYQQLQQQQQQSASTASIGSPLGEDTSTSPSGSEDSLAKQLLQRIKHPLMRAVIVDMTQKAADRRLSATEYLKILQGIPTAAAPSESSADTNNEQLPSSPSCAVLPSYFEKCIYPLYLKLHYQGMTPDDRIVILTEMYGEIMTAITGNEDSEGKSFFGLHCNPINRLINTPIATNSASDDKNVHSLLLLLPAINQMLSPSTNTVTNITTTNPSAPINNIPEKVLKARYGKKKSTTLPAGASEEDVLQNWSQDAYNDLISYTKQEIGKLESFIQKTISAPPSSTTQDNKLSEEGKCDPLVQDLYSKLRINNVASKTTNKAENSAGSPFVEDYINTFPKKSTSFFSIPGLKGPESYLFSNSGNSSGSNRPTGISEKCGSDKVGGRESPSTSSETNAAPRETHEGLVIIIDLLLSNYRHVKYSSSKIVCVMMLGRIGRYCTDPVILQRIIPLILHILEHESLVILKVLAIQILTNLLAGVERFELIEASYFPLYVFPVLNRVIKDSTSAVNAVTGATAGSSGATSAGGNAGRGGATSALEGGSSTAGGGVGEMIVRMTMMECLGTIALTAKKFLLLGQQLFPVSGCNNSNTTNVNSGAALLGMDDSIMSATAISLNSLSYEEKLHQLTETIARWIPELINEHPAGASSSSSLSLGVAMGGSTGSSYALPTTNSMEYLLTGNNMMGNTSTSGVMKRTRLGINADTVIKKVFLQHILELCWFFGPDMTMERLLTQLLTFLNDPDWELRYAFCQAIPWISAFLGPVVTCDFIIPCLENTLYHSEEKVTLGSIQAFHALVALRLVSATSHSSLLVEFIDRVTRLVLHPSTGIRLATLQVLVMICQTEGEMFAFTYVYPALEKYLYRAQSMKDGNQQQNGTGRSVKEKHWLLKQFTSLSSLVPLVIPSIPRSLLHTALQEQLYAFWTEQQEVLEIQSSLSNRGGGGSNPMKKQQQFQQLFSQYYPWLYTSTVTTGVVGTQRRHSRSSINSEIFITLPDEEKLRELAPYIQQAAKELYTKTLRWKTLGNLPITTTNGVTSASTPQRLAASRVSTNGTSSQAISVAAGGGIRPVNAAIPAPTSSVTAAATAANQVLLYSRATELEYNMFLWINAILFENQVHTFYVPYMKSTNAFLPTLTTAPSSAVSGTAGSGNSASGNTAGTGGNNAASTTGAGNSSGGGSMAIGGQVLYTVPDEWRRQSIYFTNDDMKNFWKIKALFTGLSSLRDSYLRGNNFRGNADSLPPIFTGVNQPMHAWLASNVDELAAMGGNNNGSNNRGEGSSNKGKEEQTSLAEIVTIEDSIFPYYHLRSSGAIRMTYYAYMNALAYLRQFRALQVPPLPGDFGALFPMPALPGPEGVGGAIGGGSGGAGSGAGGAGNAGGVSSVTSTSAVVSGEMFNELSGEMNASAAMSSGGGGAGGGVGGAGGMGAYRAGGPWRPRENTLVLSLREHAGPVNRLIVAQDQGYFASASADGTVKIWQAKSLEKVAFPRSVAVYTGHQKTPILDAVGIENSHSIATAGSDGSVHVFRVDMLPTPPPNVPLTGGVSVGGGGGMGNIDPASLITSATSRIMGTTILRAASTFSSSTTSSGYNKFTASYNNSNTPVSQNAVVAVQHYLNDVCSVLTYVTSRGEVYAHDLRTAKPVFSYTMRPELGYTTSMTIAPDRHWLALGTSQGVIALWDIRYQTLSALWRHSSHGPIHRLACSKAVKLGVPAPGYGGLTLREGGSMSGNNASSMMSPMSSSMSTANYSSSLASAALSSAVNGAGGMNSGNNNSNSSGLGGLASTEGAYLFVAAGRNEAAVWGLPEGGECIKCFRSLSYNESFAPFTPLPRLDPLPLPSHPNAPILPLFPHHPFPNTGNATPVTYPFTASSQTTSKLAQLLSTSSDWVNTLEELSGPGVGPGHGPRNSGMLLQTSTTLLQQVETLRSTVFTPTDRLHGPLPTSVPYTNTGNVQDDQGVHAMIGRISASNSSYLITAGNDRHIRFWDFRSPEQCYTIAGMELAQPKSIYTARTPGNGVSGMASSSTSTQQSGTGMSGGNSSGGNGNGGGNTAGSSKMFVCYTSQIPSTEKILQSQLPTREQRGLTAPSVNFKDGILDLKELEYPMKCLIASGRDGEIKIWR